MGLLFYRNSVMLIECNMLRLALLKVKNSEQYQRLIDQKVGFFLYGKSILIIA